MKKPELLLPAGNIEAFFAALEGGADAVYLGLREFNARNRARNFSLGQLAAIIKTAHEKKVKIYLTLNTLVKNSELPSLLDALHVASRLGVDAIIIQDWGVYALANTYFPALAIHASTQMGIHNSLGTQLAHRLGFERAILARELTLPELRKMVKRSKIELEIFVHGALCYSFSGMCLFSSYLGGMSANRGQCRQPCRRQYSTSQNTSFLFSLKDNQLMGQLPKLLQLPISSLKIEGRMKSAEYVYTVASAYRMAVDNPEKLPEALELLRYDMGRSKTGYFLGGSVKGAISENPYSGVFLGTIQKVGSSHITFTSAMNIQPGFRIRIMPEDGTDSMSVKISDFQQQEQFVQIQRPEGQLKTGDKVFLVGRAIHKFPSKIQEERIPFKLTLHPEQKRAMLNNLVPRQKPLKREIYLRVTSLDWLRKINMNQIHGVILQICANEIEQLERMQSFLRKFGDKVIFELPRFIPELHLEDYRSLIMKNIDLGIRHFMVSHLSQKLLIPSSNRFKISTNEWVYCLNDAAAGLLARQGINLHIYSQEQEYPNLISGKDRSGIVPLYYFPTLFYSRMPVKAGAGETIKDTKFEYTVNNKNGITMVAPAKPTSLFQFRSKLQIKGFNRFLIDLSSHKASQNTLKRLLRNFENEKSEQPSSTFNFKKGLT